MFGLFGKKEPEPAPSRVYLNQAARFAAVAEAADLGEGPRPAVVCAFPAMARRVSLELGIQRKVAEVWKGGALEPDALPILVGTELRALQGQPWRVLAVERHFLRSHDAALEEAARALPKGSSLTFWVALDDPFFTLFDPQGNLPKLLQRLGTDEGEALEHPMFSRAILNAQNKYQAHTQARVEADSSAEWLARIRG